jgi:FMN reductase (NADPH)
MTETPKSVLAPHATVRNYRPEPVPTELFDRLIAEAQQAPTDATGQMYSFVRIVDPGLRRRLAEVVGDQQHVAEAAELLLVCADLHRLGTILRRGGFEPGCFPATGMHFATVDATLAAQRLIDAAEAVGLGTCCIGGVLSGIQEIVELTALPAGVLPLFGLCLGWPAEAPARRPRVARESVLHTDHYREPSPEELHNDIARMATITRSRDWVGVLATYFSAGGIMEQREAGLRRVLQRQGFSWP